MKSMAAQKRSLLGTLDNLLLVGIAIVVALVIIGVVGAIIHTVLFLVKLLALAALVAVFFAYISRRR
jgi:amino acid transporter